MGHCARHRRAATVKRMPRIDFNCDVGEGCGDDAAILPWVTSANIACGAHAGDADTMRATLRLCRALGVVAGAHPGYPDREHFGRRELPLEAADITALVRDQVLALAAIAREEGVALRHVKPHGALYNMAAKNPAMVRAIARAIHRIDPELPLVVLAGPNAEGLRAAAAEEEVQVILEAFPDRAYDADGALRSRNLPGAVIHDAAFAAERALRMVQDGTIEAHDGSKVAMQVRSLCVHGDNPNTVALAATIRERLEAAGVTIAAA